MPFPWELNLDRPYHHESYPEQRMLSTTPEIDSATEKIDGLATD